jgi:GST-like protein
MEYRWIPRRNADDRPTLLADAERPQGRHFSRRNPEVTEWLFWQVAGLGPMAGQHHHFSRDAPQPIPYAIDRYVKETHRLYGVLDRRLATREFLAGAYSIADMAAYPWVVPHEAQGQNLSDFPHVKRWFETIKARPASIRAYELASAFTSDRRAAP